jgi:nucleotide-binding universal stress UspA family protein
VFKQILIAFDTGESSRHAVDVAVRFAAENKARLGLVYVAAPPVGYLSDAGLAAQHVLDDEHARALALLTEIRRGVPDTIDVVQFTPEGDPADAIVTTARQWGADLIVVGTHGAGRFGSFLFGSTAQSVIRKASCPVLVVRQPRPD